MWTPSQFERRSRMYIEYGTNSDFLFVIEAGIYDHVSYVCDRITPDGNSILKVQRKEPLYYVDNCSSRRCLLWTEFQHLIPSILMFIYQPLLHASLAFTEPCLPKTEFSNLSTLFVEAILRDKIWLIIAGDFDIHIVNQPYPHVKINRPILDTFNLIQKIDFANQTSSR